MMSLPEPVVIVLADDEPVTVNAGRQRRGVQVFEIGDG